MVTKEQMEAIGAWDVPEFHFGECTKTIGPRGGVKIKQVVVRKSGQLKTWVTRPTEFRLPIKYGMYESGEITHANANQFHLASECPLNDS